jgi:hypothetical protein
MSALPDLLTMSNGWSQRSTSFRFELLTAELEWIGVLEVDADRPPSITNNTNRTIKRDIDGIYISPSDASQVNPLRDRLRVIMTVDGLDVEYPLGVFVFASFQREGTGRVWRQATLLDQLALIDVKMEKGWGVPPGTRVDYALQLRMEEHGIPWFEIEESGYVVRGSEWLVWPAGGSGINVVYDLCELAGYYSTYFNNAGMGVMRSVDDLESIEPHVELSSGSIVHQNARSVINDVLDAPNRYIVISNSADYPIDGYWDVPSSAPHSITNRGRVISRTYDVQGVTDHAQATRMAKAKGQSDSSTYEWQDLTIVPVPTLDTFEVVSVQDVDSDEINNHHVQTWSMSCADADMDLEVRRIYRELVV